MADYTDLIARLEKATEGNRELDADILAALPAPFSAPGHCQMRIAAHWTTSLDAAMKLVPEGANCHGYDASPAGVEAYVSRNNVASGHWLCLGQAATPALALCIAALKARAGG